jgi:protein tyrosine phosphatase (PTP) superfamily phosphohydrolase (DUF442 family)
MSNQTLASIYNYRRISDRIGTSGMPTEAQLAEIARAGFEVVINLDQLNSKYALPNERETVESLGMTYLQIPVVWETPTHENMIQFLAAMDQYADKRVFVHCVANYRASAFIAFYRISRLGDPPAEALANLMALWQPNETWQKFIESELAK